MPGPLLKPWADPPASMTPWAPDTTYTPGVCVTNAGIIYQNQTGQTFVSAGTWSLDAVNWTALTAAGTELAYAAITANQTGISSGGTDIAGLAITFTMPNRPVWIEWGAYAIGGGPAGSDFAYILDSANNVWTQGYETALAAGAYSPEIGCAVHVQPGVNANGHTLTPGTAYTFKAHAAATGGGASVLAAATYPAFMRAEQL